MTLLHFPTDEYVQHIVRTHLNPDSGTLYWIDRDRLRNTAALQNVINFNTFKKHIGFLNLDEQKKFEQGVRFCPLENFIPKSVSLSNRTIWASQTGGTTGVPKHGCWDSLYWNQILDFSDEFLDLHRVPRNVNWLFMGPTGPHTTGRLIISITERRGGRCFSIDLDPRIVKIYGSEKMYSAYARYIKHIWDQTASIMRHQKIDVLFCTSRLLEMLPEHIDVGLFKDIKAIVHAGTSMDRDTNRLLSKEVFPGIPIVGIYGTSTTGISYQKPLEQLDDYRVVYIPSSPFLVLEIVDEQGNLVEYEEKGHVATYRLTEDSMIPGFWERDLACRVKPYGTFAERYPWDWIADVYSPEFTVEGKVEGVY